MAGYRQHLTVAGLCGAGYGVAAAASGAFTPVQGAIAAGLTGLAGMLPDLDSDSGRPLRELTSAVAAVAPLVMLRHLVDFFGSVDAMILSGGAIYVTVRYGGSWLLKRVSVHRGMFHSLPALGVAAMIVFLAYKSEYTRVRCLMAGGVAIGFLSHLVLDELYSVQVKGTRVRLNKFSGTALKWFGNDLPANAVCYALLFTLSYAALVKAGLLINLPGAPHVELPSRIVEAPQQTQRR